MALIIKNGIQAVAGSAVWTIQPPAGESWVITMYGSNAPTEVDLQMTNGTLLSRMTENNTAKLIKLFVNNSIYFRFENANAAEKHLSYSGVLL